MKYAEFTKYPKIFKHWYWGHFDCEPEANIIENRNRFIEDNNIYKHYNANSKIHRAFDIIVDNKTGYVRPTYKSYVLYQSLEPNNKVVMKDHPEFYLAKQDDEKYIIHIVSLYPPEKDYQDLYQQYYDAGYKKIPPIYSNSAVTLMIRKKLPSSISNKSIMSMITNINYL